MLPRAHDVLSFIPALWDELRCPRAWPMMAAMAVLWGGWAPNRNLAAPAMWVVLVAVLGFWPAQSAAAPYDISLRGVGRPATQDLTDSAVRRYRRLSNELVLALAPRPLAPADTLGPNGFEFSVASTWADISGNAPFWQGQPGSPVFKRAARSSNRATPDGFWVPTFQVRKGLPLSTEIGVSGALLANSEVFMLGADFKIAVHESYLKWVPALAVRGAVGRLFGASELDITSGEVDGLTSLPIPIAGTMQLTPFVGYGVVFAHVNSAVIDETPFRVIDEADQRGGDTGSLYAFPTLDWQDNVLGRLILGLRFRAAMVQVLYEFDLGFAKGGRSLESHTVKFGLQT